MMATIIVGILLALLVVLILIHLVKNRKKGGCGQGCSGCDPKNCAFYQEQKHCDEKGIRKTKE